MESLEYKKMHPTTDYIHFTGQITCKHIQTPTIQSFVLWEHNRILKDFLPFQQVTLDQTVYPYKYDVKARAFGDWPTKEYEFYYYIIHDCNYWRESKVQEVWYQDFKTEGNVTHNKNIQLE
ncbi:hypothetical protein GCK72_016045 [Caenorhabditis remanei]|uniref:Uncharacterized protein n=1 Tax=Caenorhabditis remanei TaxID=31234 RepID=A0A6A5GVS0_CAERE|nr:hypothetical protein GCK72_016045 [Caenorhabditis remanei]KAF1759578.1 hypothetical protein GCK72_016045 [Caenorhabditis remanei]